MQMNTRIAVLVAAVAAIGVLLVVLQWSGGDDRAAGQLTAAFDAEFLTRPDGYEGLKAHYNLDFSASPRQMDPGLMYRAVADGTVDVIDGFATDGRIPAYDLVVLEDDKGFFPPYYAAPVVRAETLQAHPELREALNALAGRLSDETMQALNYEADEKGLKARDVARGFLEREGLIERGAEAGDGSAGTVKVGSKHFTEQEILGEMMSLLIEHETDLKVKRNLNLGGTMICFSALKSGDLDVYAEYTGTGLVNILDRDAIDDPDRAYRAVKDAFEERYGLVWLEPFGFNNTYTLTMRREQAERLGIETISDLAAQLGER